jgi:uncharacterized cupredoxin-like copper-binding protein
MLVSKSTVVSKSMVVWKSRLAALVVGGGLLLSACGGGGGSTSTSSASLGSPGDPAKATRTVELRAGDDLRFQPDTVQVKVGETITFHIVNVATVMHDFTLGNESVQSEHEKEMSSMASGAPMDMSDSANAIHIAPGATKDLTWTFDKAGTTLYGCHEPGHYVAGMKGTITVA